jgi:hypothetical protein
MTTDEAPLDGGNATKPMLSVLNQELRREVEEDGRMLETGQLIVRRLTAKALAGNIQAIKEIFDRIDGKSVAGATPDEGPRKVTFEWKDDEQPGTDDRDSCTSHSTEGT